MKHPSTPLVIIGAGGFGREVLGLVRDINRSLPTYEFLGFLDDGELGEDLLARLDAPFLGPSSRLEEIEASFVIGIGTPGPRRRIDRFCRSWGRTPATLVHPQATIGSDVEIGEGVVIAAGARLTTHIAVGRHAQINLNCTVGHDAIVADFATLYAGVHLGGGVVIDEGAILGTGCVILPNIRVGRDAVVGAGAVAVRDVPPDTTVVGVSARPTLRANPVMDPTLPAYRAHAVDGALAMKHRPAAASLPMLAKRVGPGDADTLADLLSRIDTTHFRPHPMDADEAWRIANLDGQDLYLLGFVGGEAVAYGMLRGWDEGYSVPSLGIGVPRDRMRQGFGRAMMLALHEAARQRGAARIRLRVHPENTGAAALYRLLGYRTAGKERGEILMLKDL